MSSYYRQAISVKVKVNRKTAEFFIKCKGLHPYFERNGGSLDSAIANAQQSMDEKTKSGRDYTYSELGCLMDKLKKLNDK